MKMRDYSFGDELEPSTMDALMEFIGTMVEGLRFSCPDDSTVRVTAGTGSAQVAVGVDGLWRYRSTNFNIAISGGAGIKDIYVVAVTANVFSNSPAPDTDTTDYNFELRVRDSGSGSPGSVVGSRKVAEVDWDGAKITGLRQLVGAGDVTLPSYPIAPRPGAHAIVARAAPGQTADIAQVILDDGTVVWSVGADGSMDAHGHPIHHVGNPVDPGDVVNLSFFGANNKIASSKSAIINGSHSTANGTYTTMGTPDEVTGIVLPTAGVIMVLYYADWIDESGNTAAARAQIFVDDTGHGMEAKKDAFNAALEQPLVSSQVGLAGSGQGSLSIPGNVIGLATSGASASDRINTVQGYQDLVAGGPTFIWQPAGTYDVSVRFKTSGVNPTSVRHRRLYVASIAF